MADHQSSYIHSCHAAFGSRAPLRCARISGFTPFNSSTRPAYSGLPNRTSIQSPPVLATSTLTSWPFSPAPPIGRTFTARQRQEMSISFVSNHCRRYCSQGERQVEAVAQVALKSRKVHSQSPSFRRMTAIAVSPVGNALYLHRDEIGRASRRGVPVHRLGVY